MVPLDLGSLLTSSQATVAFYCSTWEEYHTGTLYLGYINGPTEGLIIGCGMAVISGIKGPQFWHQPAANVLPSALLVFPADWAMVNYVLVGMSSLLAFAVLPISVNAVHTVCRTPKLRKTRFRTALLQCVPMVIFLICNGLWLGSKYSVALRQHLVLFLIANGIVFGRMAVCHTMC